MVPINTVHHHVCFQNVPSLKSIYVEYLGLISVRICLDKTKVLHLFTIYASNLLCQFKYYTIIKRSLKILKAAAASVVNGDQKK